MSLPPNNTVEQYEGTKNPTVTPKGIIGETELLINKATAPNERSGMFTWKPANKWIDEAKKEPSPNSLLDSLWGEGEICILFADSGLGKSILSIQAGDSISTGIPISGFRKTAKAQKVVCFDLELTKKQFEKRYSKDFNNHYVFNTNFYRVEIDPDAFPPEGMGFQEYLNISLEQVIRESDAKVVIVDNLTYLRDDTERAKDALPLMKQLKQLKNRYGLSILALAHTPKRDNTRPISSNDLAGSRNLYNFADSCFAIGASEKDNTVRYIKQLKPRSTELMYGADNVIVCQIVKPDNFLKFEFIGYGQEAEHLKQLTHEDRQERERTAIELHDKGVSNREIARQMGVSEGAVRKWLKK